MIGIRLLAGLLAATLLAAGTAWAQDRQALIDGLAVATDPPPDLNWAEQTLTSAQIGAAVLAGMDAELARRNPGPGWAPTHPAWKRAREEMQSQMNVVTAKLRAATHTYRREALADFSDAELAQLHELFTSELGRKMVRAVSIASVANGLQNYLLSRVSGTSKLPDTMSLEDVNKIQAILKEQAASIGKLGPEEEARLKAFASDPMIKKLRQTYSRTSGRVLEFVGREIAGGGVEHASAIADRAVARFQESR